MFQAICLITLLCVILAEGITTALCYFSKGEPRKVAGAILSALMIPFSVILSCVYIVNFPFGYMTYLGLYVVAYLIVGAIILVINVFASRKNAESESFAQAKENILQLRKLVKCIQLEENADKYKKELDSLEEKLHYSNDNVIANQDEEIRSMLYQLQSQISDNEFDSRAFIEKIAKVIDARNITTGRNV